jgi:hypothetical protein
MFLSKIRGWLFLFTLISFFFSMSVFVSFATIVNDAVNEIRRIDFDTTARVLDINGDTFLTKEEYNKNKESLINHPAFSESMKFFEKHIQFLLDYEPVNKRWQEEPAQEGLMYLGKPNKSTPDMFVFEKADSVMPVDKLKMYSLENMLRHYIYYFFTSGDPRGYKGKTSRDDLKKVLEEMYPEYKDVYLTKEMNISILDEYIKRHKQEDVYRGLASSSSYYSFNGSEKKIFVDLPRDRQRELILKNGGDPDDPVFSGSSAADSASTNNAAVPLSTDTAAAVSENAESAGTGIFDPSCQAGSNIPVTGDYTKVINRIEFEAISRFLDSNGDGVLTKDEYAKNKNILENHHGLKAALTFFEKHFDFMAAFAPRVEREDDRPEGIKYRGLPDMKMSGGNYTFLTSSLSNKVFDIADLVIRNIENSLRNASWQAYRETNGKSGTPVDPSLENLRKLIEEMYPDYANTQFTDEMLADLIAEYHKRHKDEDIFRKVTGNTKFGFNGNESKPFEELSRDEKIQIIKRYGGDVNNSIYFETADNNGPPVDPNSSSNPGNDPITGNDPDIAGAVTGSTGVVNNPDPALGNSNTNVDISIPNVSGSGAGISKGLNNGLNTSTTGQSDGSKTTDPSDPFLAGSTKDNSGTPDLGGLSLGYTDGKPVILDNKGNDVINDINNTEPRISEKVTEILKDPAVQAAMKKNRAYFSKIMSKIW